MLCCEVWRLEMETNFPKKYLCSWVTGSFWVPEGKLDVQSWGRKCNSSKAFLELTTSRTSAWKDGCQRRPRGMADTTSLQLSKCSPKLFKVRATDRNRQPANVRQMKAKTSVMHGFLLVQSQSLLRLRTESFRKSINILRKGGGEIIKRELFLPYKPQWQGKHLSILSSSPLPSSVWDRVYRHQLLLIAQSISTIQEAREICTERMC